MKLVQSFKLCFTSLHIASGSVLNEWSSRSTNRRRYSLRCRNSKSLSTLAVRFSFRLCRDIHIPDHRLLSARQWLGVEVRGEFWLACLLVKSHNHGSNEK